MTEDDIIVKPSFQWFSKYWFIILLLIPIILSASLRLQSESLPITDDWAKQSVDGYYSNQFISKIVQNYPNLPQEQILSLAKSQYAEYYATNKVAVDQQIVGMSSQLKQSYQDENGVTYMPDIDPYAYVQGAENFINHGYIGDTKINGTMYNMHMLAPKGAQIGNDPHPVVLAYLYKIIHIINPNITVIHSSTYFPIIIICLCIIPIFFIGRRFSGNVGGFFSAMVFAVSSALFSRTSWGHADTDAYNVLFPIYILFFFFYALESETTKKKVIYSTLAGLTMGIFAIFWTGWWYIFDFMIGSLFLYSIFKRSIDYKASGIFIGSSLLFVSLFTSFSDLINYLFIQPFIFMNIKSASHENLWPNVYTTVAEMNGASIASVIGSIGGSLFFYGAILGLVLLALANKRKYLYHSSLLMVWIIGIFYAATSGIRFAMMLTPPIALGMGALVGMGNEYVEKFFHGNWKKAITCIVVVLCCLTLIPQIRSDNNMVKNDVPMINDAWVKVLTDIKIQSEPDAVINSWWDFGHHFKYYTDRAVTFDGASQNTPMAHWIGKVLITSNEDEAVQILRMLDCGAPEVYIVPLNGTPKGKFCDNPPENYFITSGDMISKSGVWGHFGNWNFQKAYLWTKSDLTINDVKETLKLNDSAAKNIFYEIKSLGNEANANNWISDWPGYSGSLSCIDEGIQINCEGVVISKETKEARFTAKDGEQYLHSLVYLENGTFMEKNLDEGFALSGVLQHNEDDNSYRLTPTTPIVATSIFTRLYFFDGIGLTHFKKFSEAQTPDGTAFIAWKVVW
jgi:dolichyl-diphosphooligosaccharide--protein glycosyltransferase